MPEPFAPQFLILLGIDIFLGNSILTVMLDDAFSDALPYILDFGSLVGFAQLLIGPRYLAGFSIEMQFFYSAGYVLVSLMSVLGASLYLYFVKRRHVEGMIFGMVAGLPSSLITAFFVSAFVNGVPLTLPSFPVLPWSFVYLGVSVSTVLLLVGMVFAVYKERLDR